MMSEQFLISILALSLKSLFAVFFFLEFLDTLRVHDNMWLRNRSSREGKAKTKPKKKIKTMKLSLKRKFFGCGLFLCVSHKNILNKLAID